MKLKKLIKSYSFWTALAGALVALINAVGRVCGFFVDESSVSDIVMAVAGLLVVLGVVTMPKLNEDSAKEDKEEKEGK